MTLADQAAIPGHDGRVTSGKPGKPKRRAFTAEYQARIVAAFEALPENSPELARHLAFRDYLRTHPGQAGAYAELKRSLAAQFRSDRDAYSRSKAAFVEQALAAATRPCAATDSIGG